MKRGMEAVIEKANNAMRGKRLPMMKRKPGLAIMVAVGKPKMGPPRPEAMEARGDEREPEGEVCPECGYKHSKAERMGEKLSKGQKIAALEEKIGYLKAELALLKDEEEGEEMDEEMDDEEMDGEDEEDAD